MAHAGSNVEIALSEYRHGDRETDNFFVKNLVSAPCSY